MKLYGSSVGRVCNHANSSIYSVLSYFPIETCDKDISYQTTPLQLAPCLSLFTLQHMSATVLVYKLFYWQGDLDVKLKAWEKHTSRVWILKSHFALLDTMGTQTLTSKLKLAAGNKDAITVTLHPLQLPFWRNTSQFHLERNSHKIQAPSSPRTTGQYVGRHSHLREASLPQGLTTIPSENTEVWRDAVLEGSWLSSKLLLHFYIKFQLECQMSF